MTPHPGGHIADDRLAALVNVDVLDRDALLSLAPMPVQSLHQLVSFDHESFTCPRSRCAALPSETDSLEKATKRKPERLQSPEADFAVDWAGGF